MLYQNTGCSPVKSEILHFKEALKGRNKPAIGQSLSQNYIHIIFSTKKRKPLILPEVENELHAYIGGICKRMDSTPIKIGGTANHIHILCKLSKKVTLVKLMEDVKSHSSNWIKTKSDRLRGFYWQDGYSAFSVNPAEVDVAINYIANQKEHHKQKSFQEEYRAFLKKYNVDYDERYVWD